MAYIGNPPLDVRSFGSTKFEFTATAGQTAFTGTDDNNIPLAFVEDQIEVYVNGVLMDNSDFSSSGGNTVTLAAAAAVNDIVTVIAAKTNVPNVDYVAATGGTFTGNVNFGDNDRIRLGDGNDLQLYHDGSRSIIQDSGTGNLRIQANNLELNNADNSENYLFAANNGAVTLYYDNAAKLATTSTGVDVSGSITLDANGTIGVNASNALQFTSSSHAVLTLGGSEILRATDGKNLGIGTSAPHDSGANFSMLTLNGPKGGGIVFSDDDVNQHQIYTTDDASLRFARGSGLSDESMRIDSAGRVGIGIAPDNWSTSMKALQIGSAAVADNGANDTFLGANYYYDGSNNKYINTGEAAALGLVNGQFQFFTASSGSADANVSFDQAMTLDANGHLGIGTTTPADTSWGHSSHGNTEVAIDGGGGYGVLHFRGDGANTTDTRFSVGVGDERFYMAYDDVSGVHRMTMKANGQLGIGRQPTSSYKLDFYEELSGNWLAHIHNSHATNGYGVKIRAGDDNNVSAFRVSSQDNNTTILDCTGGGIVTKPNQPYFNVTRNGSSYSAANNATLIFNRVMSNVGSHYSSSTGRFTAPVAGKYLFLFQSITLGNYNNASIRIFRNGARFYGSDIHFSPYLSSTSYWDHVTNNQIISLNAGDYVEVKNVGPTVTYHGDHWSHFTGMLLG